MKSKIETLRSASLFAKLPESAISQLSTLLTPLTLTPGERAFSKGDIGDALFLVVSGRVCVHDADKVIDELEPGDIFGEMALLDEEVRSASVSAEEPTLLFRLDQASFFRLLEEQPEVSREIIKVLSQRLRAKMHNMVEDQRYIAQLYQSSLEAERMAKELELASRVQSGFMPQDVPSILGWEFAAGWQPARELSGDFYDFILLDSGLGLVIADVADKGMPAALFMALTRSVLRSSVSTSRAPERSIAQANRLLAADAADGMFVTLVYVQLMVGTNELRYVNAGHNPPLLFRAASQELIPLARTGIFLGWDPTAKFESRTVNLEPDDFVLFYTDGVTEAVNAEGEAFGEERLEACLLKYHTLSADELLKRLQNILQDFTGVKEPYDDITLLIAKRLESA